MTINHKLQFFFASFLLAALTIAGCNAGGSYEYNGVAISMSPSKTIKNTKETEILERAVYPFLDYYFESGVEIGEVSVNFVDMSLMDRTFPYKAIVSYAGEKEGELFSEFLIEEDENEEIVWWTPGCDNEAAPCSFSEAFAEKYPEVYEAAEYKTEPEAERTALPKIVVPTE